MKKKAGLRLGKGEKRVKLTGGVKLVASKQKLRKKPFVLGKEERSFPRWRSKGVQIWMKVENSASVLRGMKGKKGARKKRSEPGILQVGPKRQPTSRRGGGEGARHFVLPQTKAGEVEKDNISLKTTRRGEKKGGEGA